MKKKLKHFRKIILTYLALEYKQTYKTGKLLFLILTFTTILNIFFL